MTSYWPASSARAERNPALAWARVHHGPIKSLFIDSVLLTPLKRGRSTPRNTASRRKGSARDLGPLVEPQRCNLSGIVHILTAATWSDIAVAVGTFSLAVVILGMVTQTRRLVQDAEQPLTVPAAEGVQANYQWSPSAQMSSYRLPIRNVGTAWPHSGTRRRLSRGLPTAPASRTSGDRHPWSRRGYHPRS